MPLFVYEVRKFAGHRCGFYEAAKQLQVSDDGSEIMNVTVYYKLNPYFVYMWHNAAFTSNGANLTWRGILQYHWLPAFWG